ncbi:hypothetical protein H5410_038601 [Solanum commersonii]|uniref:Receptor-like serine/threonine-protein kinase n=1 Tax=Solanum commersonii TaxID=4109 RepID=A0A9J5YAK9_SOLCO|nr:hypothetical protein H5410_038601 [Solanum commersonii]
MLPGQYQLKSLIQKGKLKRRNVGSRFLCGFYCNYNVTECLLGILLYHINYNKENDVINKPQLVWSANRNHPVKFNATLQLGHDGNLVLTDSDGTLVWSTDTIGKSVSGLNLTEMGNLVLFDKRKRTIWQSFDHPTDSLLPGQNLVSGQKLIASVSATNRSQGLFSLTVLYSRWTAYTDTDPHQYYYTSYYGDSPYYSFDGQTFTALHYPTNSTTQFMKIGPDGHLKVYQWSVVDWNEVSDILSPYVENCGYPMVCGSYSICTNNGQCTCTPQEHFFRPFSERKPDLGCSQLTSIYCNSLQYHSFIELKNTTYFSFNIDQELNLSKLWLAQTKLEDCKRACLNNYSCKAAVFEYHWKGAGRGNCLLLNEVFSLTDSQEGRGNTVFLKVQNASKAQTQSLIIPLPGGKKSRPFKVIIGSTLAAFFGIILSIATCFVIFRKRAHESRKAADNLDLAPILPGILTRFSYNELKITTDDFSRKLGEGGFGCVYEGTLRNGTKIVAKHLDGVGQVKESFLTEVKAVGGIHHINLVKLIGFCAEKSHRLLIYVYMVNGSLDRLISGFGLSKLIEKDKSKVVTRMRGTRGYLVPEWLSSVITEKVDVYAFGIVLLEILCGRKAEQEQLMDMVDKNEDMQLHREAVTEMMSLAAWCLQGNFSNRPSMSLVVKALEGLVTVETKCTRGWSRQPTEGSHYQFKSPFNFIGTKIRTPLIYKHQTPVVRGEERETHAPRKLLEALLNLKHVKKLLHPFQQDCQLFKFTRGGEVMMILILHLLHH